MYLKVGTHIIEVCSGREGSRVGTEGGRREEDGGGGGKKVCIRRELGLDCCTLS